MSQAPVKFMIVGKSGWIGGLLGEMFAKDGTAFEYAEGRMEDRQAIAADLARIKPTHVLNCAGVTGRPNVDWCEDHQVETIRANVIGTLTLADVCLQHNVHVTNFATGCIFEYDATHTEHSGNGFKEEDTPNFTGSFYSLTKAMVERLLHAYPNTLTLRVRMPIVQDLTYPRNFITKILKYPKVVNIQNSMTVLPEMLPMGVELARRGRTGIYNFTNPGTCSHNEILQMYKDIVDPSYTWTNFTLEEQAQVIKAPRSNNELDASKLKAEFPELLSLRESLLKYVFYPQAKVPINQ